MYKICECIVHHLCIFFQVVSRHTLKNLTKYVDPNVQLDDDTEDMMLVYADDFMERLIEGACKLAKHRKATSVDVQDLETYMGNK